MCKITTKILSLSFFLLTCYGSAFSQYKFVLDVKTKTLSDNKIKLNIFNNRNYIPIKIDSFILEKGHHIIYGELSQPSNFASLIVQKNGLFVDQNFVLDSGRNVITLDLPVGKTRNLVLTSNARGNFIFNDLNNLFNETVNRYKDPVRVKGYLYLPEKLQDSIVLLQLKRLETYPNDFASLIYLSRISRAVIEPIQVKNNLATLTKFNDDLKNSILGKQIYTEGTDLIKNKIAASVGNEVKTFSVSNIDNKVFSNTELAGQPYVIVFSATWCGPCQVQLPRLKSLYDTYKAKGLKVIYFNDDDDVIRWQNHVSKNKLTWINVSEKVKPNVSKIQKSFGVLAVPTCLVIDKTGTIVYNSDQSDTGIERIESYIKKVLL